MQKQRDYDHRENIAEAFRSHTEGVHDAESLVDYLADDVLEVEVWTSNRDSDRTRVDITLTIGGPTVVVTVDEYDRVTYFHSWGKREEDGRDQVEYEPYGDDADVWVELADIVRESWT